MMGMKLGDLLFYLTTLFLIVCTAAYTWVLINALFSKVINVEEFVIGIVPEVLLIALTSIAISESIRTWRYRDR